MQSQRVIATSGYFDPLHLGHLEYLEKARQLGDKLIVIVNNDNQAKLKKGFSLLNEKERMRIVGALKCVDEVILSIDEDKSVCKTLELIKPNIFAKGGDRNSENIPEKEICDKMDCEIVDGLGEKINSSSDIIKKMNEQKQN